MVWMPGRDPDTAAGAGVNSTIVETGRISSIVAVAVGRSVIIALPVAVGRRVIVAITGDVGDARPIGVRRVVAVISIVAWSPQRGRCKGYGPANDACREASSAPPKTASSIV